MTATKKTYATARELAEALNDAKVSTERAEWTYISPRFPHLSTWTLETTGDMEGRAIIACDGKKWHKVWSTYGGGWIDPYPSKDGIKLANPTARGYTTVEQYMDYLKRARTDLIKTPAADQTFKVRFEVSAMGDGTQLHVYAPFSHNSYHDGMMTAMQAVVNEFSKRGYNFDHSMVKYELDSNFFVGEIDPPAKKDPLEGLQYAGVSIRGLSSAALAQALNREVGNPQNMELRASWGDQAWRSQAGYDSDGDRVVFVHNGEKWVSAFYSPEEKEWTEYHYDLPRLLISASPPVEQRSAEDYLKQFEPKESQA